MLCAPHENHCHIAQTPIVKFDPPVPAFPHQLPQSSHDAFAYQFPGIPLLPHPHHPITVKELKVELSPFNHCAASLILPNHQVPMITGYAPADNKILESYISHHAPPPAPALYHPHPHHATINASTIGTAQEYFITHLTCGDKLSLLIHNLPALTELAA